MPYIVLKAVFLYKGEAAAMITSLPVGSLIVLPVACLPEQTYGSQFTEIVQYSYRQPGAHSHVSRHISNQ